MKRIQSKVEDSAIEKYVLSPLVTVSEAAKFLGVGRQVIYRLIEEDRLRASRVARAVLVEQNSLEAFKESGELT